MAYKKGESGNLSGRPPKSRALSDILAATLSKTIETDEGKIAGKRLLASLVIDGITTGKVKFPGDEVASTLGMKDWIEFVKWAYQYLDPPITKIAPTTPDGTNPYMSADMDELKELARKVVNAGATQK